MGEKQIKVFLIDDEPLVLEGWRHLLVRAGGFQIVGESTPENALIFNSTIQKLDIVIAGAGLLNLNICNEIISNLHKFSLSVKIVIVANNQDEILKAQHSGVDEAIQSPFQRTTFLNLLRGVNLEPKKRCSYFVEQLENIINEEPKRREYGIFVGDILEFLFAPYLDGRYMKFYNNIEDIRCNILFQNRFPHFFWDRIRTLHNGEKILFGVNYKNAISADQIKMFGEKLSKEIGGIGFIVTVSNQNEQMKNLQKAIYRNENKIVIQVSDIQIKDMLIQKAAGIDPSEILQDIYLEFMADLLLS